MHREVAEDPAEFRRQVLERDGYRCKFALCRSPRDVQVDHIVERSSGGSDDLNNAVSLCAAHHRLKHAGLFVVLADGNGGVKFFDLRSAVHCQSCGEAVLKGEIVAVFQPPDSVTWRRVG